MATNWTKEQKAAMMPTDRLTVLSAAAGSGKTTVLVERALRLLLDEDNPISADRLLIATFSNASAREFKNRIERGISQKIRENPQNNFIKKQKIALQKADISTIHAFCIKLVRENFQQLDLSLNFSICDEAQSALLHEKAIERAMSYGYTLPNFKKLVSFYGRSSQDSEIRKFLLEMNYFFSALPEPLKRAEEMRENYDENLPLSKSPWLTEIIKGLEQKADYLVYLSERMAKLYEKADFSGYEDGIAKVVDLSIKIKALTKGQLFDELYSICSGTALALGRAKPACEDSKIINEGVYKEYKAVLKEMENDIKFIVDGSFQEHMKGTKPYIDVLIDVYLYYQKCLAEVKKEKESYEFSDFEHFALKLLKNPDGSPTPLAIGLREHYEYIMEDEFQDTSYVQDAIFTMIARENQKNLYVVGDVKQSIYGFRKASPEIFLSKRQVGIEDKSLGNTIFLPHNFRSSPSVIRGVNYIFNRLMTTEVGGVDYAKDEYLKTLKTDDFKEVALKINIYQDNEAENVAKTISQMIKSGYQIEENGELRCVKNKDFCILMRNSKNFTRYKNALKQLGCEAFVKDDELILKKAEIQSLISILRVVSNPLQEVYLTAAMFGDIFSFSLDEILKIRTKDKSQSLYKALALSDEAKAKYMLGVLKDITWAADTFSADKLIDYICKKTGYYSRLAFSEDGGEKRENIRWFISFAKNYALTYQSSIQGFVRWIDMYLASGKGGSSDVQKPENAVSIMTMHTSKGLEYPICFVCGLATKFNTMDRSKHLMLDVELGIATYYNSRFGYNYSTIGIQALKRKKTREMANEEMRLLYVAFTRAKNLLVLSGEYNSSFTENTLKKLVAGTGETVNTCAIQRGNSPIRWVISAFASHPVLVDKFGFGTPDQDSARCGDIEFLSDETQADGAQNTVYQTPIEAEVSAIEEHFEYTYPKLAKTRLPIKLSVSEIAKTPPPLVLASPDFLRENKVTPAEKGSAMHRFVQHCDILLARANFDSELVRLENLGLVDSTLLDIQALKFFIESPVAVKILNGEKVFVEKDFLVPYNAGKAMGDSVYENDELLVQGVMDCVVVNGDDVLVIDYKTDRVQTMQQLKERYSAQLELYRYSAKQLFETDKVACLIYSFHLNDFMEF
ncbi:MAG: UvrD-helicase domain-containing protein [Oscillospiraceae bacterium]